MPSVSVFVDTAFRLFLVAELTARYLALCALLVGILGYWTAGTDTRRSMRFRGMVVGSCAALVILLNFWNISYDEDNTQYISDNRAVTPVVSPILMVAIVVVLGTTTSAVALGLAADIRSPAPQAHFDFDLDESTGVVTVTKDAGDTIDGDQLKFSGAAKTKKTYGSISEWVGKDVQAGDSATVEVTGGETLELIWQSPNGDTEAILAKYDVPNNIGGTVLRGEAGEREQ